MKSISFSKIPLAWPLAISLAGTIGSLAFGGKKVHIIFGAAMAGFSVLHAIQHRKSMLRPIEHGIHKAADTFEIPHTGPDFFLRGVDVTFFMPGRIRLYSHTLKNDAAYKVWVRKYLAAFTTIGDVQINPVTGSILITYDTEAIQHDIDLLRVEGYMKERAIRRVIL